MMFILKYDLMAQESAGSVLEIWLTDSKGTVKPLVYEPGDCPFHADRLLGLSLCGGI